MLPHKKLTVWTFNTRICRLVISKNDASFTAFLVKSDANRHWNESYRRLTSQDYESDLELGGDG
jgi:hypothetical protein